MFKNTIDVVQALSAHSLRCLFLRLVPLFVVAGLMMSPVVQAAPQVSDASGHALVGRIWDTRGGRFIAEEALMREIGGARYVLLGEVHTNAEHHRHQATIIQALVAAGRRPAVVFEMFDREQQVSLARSIAEHPGDIEALAEVTEFERRGWPLATYRALLERVFAERLDWVAGNLSRKEAGRIVEQGKAAFGDARRSELALDVALGETAQAALEARLIESHCGHLPASLLPGMLLAQRSRDALLADALIVHGRSEDGAVLIAGGGHVRRDYAVPFYLRARMPGEPYLSLGLIEVQAGRDAIGDYADELRDANAAPLFDYVWFTARSETEDPCRKYEKGLRRLEQRGRNTGTDDRSP